MDQLSVILSLRHFDPDLKNKPIKERVAERLPPECLFGDDVCVFKAIYLESGDILDRNGATIPRYSAHSIICQLTRDLYDEPEKKEVANIVLPDMTRMRPSAPQKAIQQDIDDRPWTLITEKVVCNISTRLKVDECRLSRNRTKYWDEDLDNYRQIARDYRLSDLQTLQYLQDNLSKDAKRYCNNVAAPHAALFQQAVDYISRKYTSPVQEHKVKNYVQSIGVNSLMTKGTKAFKAVSLTYRINLKLSPQYPGPHRRDVYKFEDHRAAVLAYKRTRELLFRATSQQLTYQQLYSEL